MTKFHPRVPITPVLSRASVSGARARPACVLDAGAVRLVTSGRAAIALALREMGVGRGDEVLVPAYHSPSMVPPVCWLGARPVFYRVGPDASVDLDDAASRITPATRAIMVTAYFGFPQDLAAIRAFCDSHGLLMLEDCAHSFFGEHKGRPAGAWGDYAVASSMKFFPVYDGGCLVSARHSLAGVGLRPAGAGFEAKAVLAALEGGFAYGRLPLLEALLRAPLWLKDALWQRVKSRRGGAPAALAPASSDSAFDFEPGWVDKRCSRFSQALMTLSSGARIVTLRRAHYRALEQALRGLSGCRPLYPALPDGVCPWQFPLLVEDPEPVFEALHAAGVPVVRFAQQRWPGMDPAAFPDSAALARQVLAFPCHQELRPDELAWMAGQVRAAVMAQVPA